MLDDFYAIRNGDMFTVLNIKNLKFTSLSKRQFYEFRSNLANKKNSDELSCLQGLQFPTIDRCASTQPFNYANELNPQLLLSYNCNYNCVYCYQKNRKSFNEKIHVEDIGRIDSFYDEYCLNYGIEKKYGNISIIGGEPLLPENRGIWERIVEQWEGCSFIVTTNGSYMNEYYSLLEKLNCDLRVSLDGTWETHRKKERRIQQCIIPLRLKGLTGQ